MQRVYLHIGRAKTGSTAIQRAMEANRDRLSHLGFAYPGDARNHNTWVGVWPKVEFSEPAAILSSEGLQNIEPGTVRAWLHGFDVRVLVYLRDPIEAVISHYQQEVKANLETRTFEEYAATAPAIDYTDFIAAWRNAFEHVTIRPYRRNIVPDFLDWIGIEGHAPFLLNEPDPNPSIAGDLLEAKRLLNKSWSGSAEELRAQSYGLLLNLANANAAWRGRLDVSDKAIAMLRARQTPSHAL